MSRVLSNNSSFALAIEDSPGTLPGSPSWHLLEPNSVSRGGAEITTVARKPISRNRQNRKGAITDLDSGWEAELDLTLEHLQYLLPPAMYTTWQGPPYFAVTGVTSTGYTVASGGALPAGTLIVASGFALAANNSPETFKVVGASSTSTEIKTSGLATEASIPASQNAMVEVAGVRGGSGDITMTVSGSTYTLGSTTLDFTTLNLNVGQFIWIGGAAGSAYAFANSAVRGLARIVSIAAHAIVVDKTSSTFVSDTGSGKTIELYFGRWARNVPVGDADYLEQPFQVETTYVDLEAVGTPRYSYATGNIINTMTLSFQGQDKATMSIEMIGLDTGTPTLTQKTNADAPVEPVKVAAINTAADFTRLRVTEVDETGVTTDFKDLSITLGNNVSPEKVLGTLGARYMNVGNFDVNGECNVVLTDVAVMEAVRDNRLMTAEIGFRCTDGGCVLDFPSITMGNGQPEIPADESVSLPLSLMAVQDTTLGYTMSASMFPYLPAS